MLSRPSRRPPAVWAVAAVWGLASPPPASESGPVLDEQGQSHTEERKVGCEVSCKHLFLQVIGVHSATAYLWPRRKAYKEALLMMMPHTHRQCCVLRAASRSTRLEAALWRSF